MTFAVEEAGQILSQDARGRVLVSREHRESLLEEYDQSGMSDERSKVRAVRLFSDYFRLIGPLSLSQPAGDWHPLLPGN